MKAGAVIQAFQKFNELYVRPPGISQNMIDAHDALCLAIQENIKYQQNLRRAYASAQRRGDSWESKARERAARYLLMDKEYRELSKKYIELEHRMRGLEK